MINKILIGVVIVFVVALIGFFIATFESPEPVEDDPIEIAEEWVLENASTFTERGGFDLQYEDIEETEEGVYEVTFHFDSEFAGYGPVEEEEAYAQVITPHSIVITVKDGEVVKAITDEVYDEINKEMLEEKEDKVEFDLYFYIIEDGEEKLSSVSREIPVPQDKKEAALYELLKGPTEEEKEEGYSTAIDEGTKLLSFHIEEGTGYADFSEELDASGSATVIMIREQIEKTLLQFDMVDDVVISIEGETEDILQP